MPETVEKPEDRSVEELLEGLKQAARDIKEGRTISDTDKLRERIGKKKERQE